MEEDIDLECIPGITAPSIYPFDEEEKLNMRNMTEKQRRDYQDAKLRGLLSATGADIDKVLESNKRIEELLKKLVQDK